MSSMTIQDQTVVDNVVDSDYIGVFSPEGKLCFPSETLPPWECFLS